MGENTPDEKNRGYAPVLHPGAIEAISIVL